MAAGTLINFRLGSVGRKVVAGEVTLSSGTGTVTHSLTSVEYAFVTQKDATAVADGVSWSDDGDGTTTIDSSNGSSAETYSVLLIGY